MTTLKTKLKPQLVPATNADYPVIQNLARFYVYDMARYCGFISDEWACPADGLYECYDFKTYFEDTSKQPFLIKVDHEIAGFVLLNKEGTSATTQWNMGQFFILSKFQRSGIGKLMAEAVWNSHPGTWEISVIPENTAALHFWRKTIAAFTKGNYSEEVKVVNKAIRHILNFDTNAELSVPISSKDKNVSITFVDNLSEELEERMSAGFIQHETIHGIDVNYKTFALKLTNDKNLVCAALTGYSAFSEIYIDDLWVDQEHRKKGYGKALVTALEEHFKGQGFNNINLVTSAFQAPEFYKKCGFTTEFIRVNKINPQLSKTFFVKFFNDEIQKQGILNENAQP